MPVERACSRFSALFEDDWGEAPLCNRSCRSCFRVNPASASSGGRKGRECRLRRAAADSAI